VRIKKFCWYFCTLSCLHRSLASFIHWSCLVSELQSHHKHKLQVHENSFE
jgi:hypothetical protein